MTTDEFGNILETRIKKMRQTLASKAKEYSRGDRLSNLKDGASFVKSTEETYLLNLWTKHVISIRDLVRDLENGRMNEFTLWDEKIGDAVNYLVLLDALIHERSKR